MSDSTFTQIYTHWPDRNAVLASRQCLFHINWMFPGFRVHVWFFCTRMFPDFGIQWCFASRYSMTCYCVVLHPDIPWLCYYVFALHPDIPWLWYNVLFYIPIFRDFVTMYCFISGYSVTLLLCVVLYYGFSGRPKTYIYTPSVFRIYADIQGWITNENMCNKLNS
jgi:hypothetical protein